MSRKYKFDFVDFQFIILKVFTLYRLQCKSGAMYLHEMINMWCCLPTTNNPMKRNGGLEWH